MKRYHEIRKEKLLKTVSFENLPQRMRKERIFEEVGNRSEKCGLEYSDERGKGPFEIHHIDGNNNNWKRENLEILCLICHWKTPNWRFRGRKHTEKTRKKISKNNARIGGYKHLPDGVKETRSALTREM